MIKYTTSQAPSGRVLEWDTPIGSGRIEFGEDGELVNCEHTPRDPQPTPLTPSRIVHGAAGLAKAALRIDPASDETQASRLAVCQTCDQARKADGKVRTCKICGCRLISKIKLASESCPIDKWPAVEPKP